MKSADYWAAEMECAGDNVARVEAIREEMRQECLSSLVTAVEKHGSAAVLSEFGDAIRNAGKPKADVGLIVGVEYIDRDGIRRSMDFAAHGAGVTLSDICYKGGKPFWDVYCGNPKGLIFLKEAMV